MLSNAYCIYIIMDNLTKNTTTDNTRREDQSRRGSTLACVRSRSGMKGAVSGLVESQFVYSQGGFPIYDSR